MTPPTPVLEVARERLLPLADRDHRPLFGPDGAITVGTTRFAPDGHRSLRSQWAQNGQIHPVAVIGTAAKPQVLALAWGSYPHPSGGEADENSSWLIAGDPVGRAPSTFVPTRIEFTNESIYEQGAPIELSPDRQSIVAVEHGSVDEVLLAGAETHPETRDEWVVRGVPAGNVRARIAIPDKTPRIACWVDAHRIASRASAESLSLYDLTTRTATTVRTPTGELVACAAGGGSAAIVTPAGLAIIDLATGRTRGTPALDAPRGTPNVTTEEFPDDEALPAPARDRFALGRDGCDVAMLRARTLTVLQCETLRGDIRWYRTTLVRTLAPDARPPRYLEFSPDARRLALVGDSLVVLETAVPHRAPPALPVMAELPTGFTAIAKQSGPYEGWSYAQVGTPSGLVALPAKIVHARRDDDPADVITIAMELDAVSTSPPPAGATDAAIRAYALAVMPELVEQWRNAEVGTDRDAEFTLKVGHRDGKPFFETREAWRDGCEPYDGYTQVVIDRDLLFVTRALVVPAASTNPWLQRFYDVPFQRRTQLARRRGPETGPC